MELKQVHYENILEHVGYTGGRSRNRINTNYKQVGTKIKDMNHTPPFEHFCLTFDLNGTSRFLLYLLSTSRVLTLTANSQRYLEVYDVLDTYNNDSFVLNCLNSYKEARKDNIKKEGARALLPLASKTADLSFTLDIRELNRLYRLFSENYTCPECLEFASKIGNYLQSNNVFFQEPLPSGYFPSIKFKDFKKEKPSIGESKVTKLDHTGFLTQFVLTVPFYVWMQIIRHKSLSFTDMSITNTFESTVFDYLDSFEGRDATNPYHILNGQFVTVLVGGPDHAWENLFRWRLDKATQPVTQKIVQEIAAYF